MTASGEFSRAERTGITGLAVALTLTIALTGCTSPTARFDDEATRVGLLRSEVRGLNFDHAVYHRPGKTHNEPLHIYLTGDGTPWRAGRWPAVDPTPREPVVTELIAVDSYPVVVLGRPCYHGFSDEPECDSVHWTSARYSERIIDSMSAAARRLMKHKGYEEAVLIGYSGGGSLAVLMADQMPSLRSLVTIAANLDISAWTHLHGYLPLANSLNPRDHLNGLKDLPQRHYFGANDTNVPIAMANSIAIESGTTAVRILPGFDHRCCWRQQWPTILTWIETIHAGPAFDARPSRRD